MPWGRVPMKDASSGDTPGGAARARGSRGFRMGQPGRGNARPPAGEHIAGEEGTRGTETSQYPEEKKAEAIPPVAASDRGEAQTGGIRSAGVVGRTSGGHGGPVRSGLERPAGAGESPVGGFSMASVRTRVPRGTSNPAGIWEDHLPRLNTLCHR